MLKIIALIITMVVLTALPCRAAEKTAYEITSGISENLGKVSDFKANVEIILTNDNIEEHSSGKLYFKSPDRYRVELFFPKKQIVIANGSQLVIIDPVSSKQIRQDISRLSEKETMALPFIPDINKYLSLFNFSIQGHDGDSVLLKGEPRDKNRNIGRIDLYCDTASNVPSRIVSYNRKGSLVSLREIKYLEIGKLAVPSRSYAMAILPSGTIQADIEYKNIKVNSNLPDSLFRIK